MNREEKINYIIQIRAEKCRRSFYFFIKEFWSEIESIPFSDNWHIQYLANRLQEHGTRLIKGEHKTKDILINISPGSTKSTIVSVMFPLWLWINKSKLKIAQASKSQTISVDLSVKSKTILISDKFKSFFPYLYLAYDASAKQYYKNNSGGLRFSTSVNSTILGFHYDAIICDDLESLESTYSEAESNSITSWLTGSLLTRKTNVRKSLVIYVMQRLANNDLSNYLLTKKFNIEHICIPAELNETIKPAELAVNYINGLFNSSRLDKKDLDEIRKQIGSRNYSAQFLQKPNSESDALVKKSWINIISNLDVNGKPHYTNEHIFYVIDTSFGNTNSADYSVIMGFFIKNNCLYIKSMQRVIMDWLDFHQLLIKTVPRNAHLYIEAKATGLSLIQMLRKTTMYHIIELQPKESKIVRLQAVVPLIESKRLFIYDDIDYSQIVDELTFVSNYKDTLDCVVYGLQLLLNGSNRGSASKPKSNSSVS